MSSDVPKDAQTASSGTDNLVTAASSSSSMTQAVWDPIIQTWIYTDPATGNQFEWNATAQTYVPRVRH